VEGFVEPLPWVLVDRESRRVHWTISLTNLAPASRSIANGVMHSTCKSPHAAGILILFGDVEETSCVTRCTAA
jgi:hypothetical protein